MDSRAVTEDGLRVALMHGGLDNLRWNHPADVARKRTGSGGLRRPARPVARGRRCLGVVQREKSIQRRLVYSMAPEAQHINQGFVGAYTNVSLAENGELKALAELRSVNFDS